MAKVRIKIAIKDVKIVHVSEIKKIPNVYSTMTLFNERILHDLQFPEDYYCVPVRCQINQGDDIVEDCWYAFRNPDDPEIFKGPQYISLSVLKLLASEKLCKRPKNQDPLEDFAFEIIGEQYTVPLRGFGTFAEIVNKLDKMAVTKES